MADILTIGRGMRNGREGKEVNKYMRNAKKWK
jgi:hypothetical protein